MTSALAAPAATNDRCPGGAKWGADGAGPNEYAGADGGPAGAEYAPEDQGDGRTDGGPAGAEPAAGHGAEDPNELDSRSEGAAGYGMEAA